MLNEIKTDLGANFNTGDETILENYIDDFSVIALDCTNRPEGDTKVNPYIKTAVKSAYLKRGDEGLKSSGIGGISSSYEDIVNKLREDLIKNGLRLIK